MKLPIRFLVPVLLFAGLAGVLAVGLRLDPNRLPSALIGKPAPVFSLESLGDPAWKVGSADMARQAWVLNVWGTWCPPCVREVPLLVDLVEQAQGALTVVGVLTQDTPVNGLEFARQFGVNYTSVLDDDGTVMRAYSPGPPVTLFLSADGQVRHVKRGEFTDATELRTLLQQHLGVALPVPP